ncbi:EpsG family protein [Shewanella sp. CG12_big_fil_rev_8_21_14_0_65_47_15]|uniref:EpsG family protein n=1 Tax=Shewanella sp. CG12_big_fil_rev_8_21_14_0_65_47_15 TaxID=1975537 RepID=UPI000CA85B30|nr:EpsG family protein [Shewanella sp. CG12_big_fil_rev_8_21_14_0_65_47_15]PIW59851.1 MAG: hypothetical protein COW15_15695 [Shewanella sp. CG12_big_fil_rev_8_21_14_0_65_47_15]
MYLFIIYTFFLFASFVKSNVKYKKLTDYCYFFFLWLFSSTTMNGKDKLSYEGMFLSINPNDIHAAFSQVVVDKGYYFLNLVVRFFTDEFVIFLMTASLITTFLTFKAFKYFEFVYKIRIELIFLVYLPTVFIAAQMGALRQSIAIAIFLFSFRYLLENKNVKYLICILFASTFHMSALILMLLPLFFYFKGRKKLLIIALVHLSFFIFLMYISSTVEIGRLMSYAKDSASYGMIGVLERLTFLSLFLFIYMKRNNDDKVTILMEIYFLYVLQSFVFDSFFAVMYRIKLYYFGLFSVLFPILFCKMTYHKANLGRFILYLYGIIQVVAFTSPQEVKDYFFPYRNYFFDEHTNSETQRINDTISEFNILFELK